MFIRASNSQPFKRTSGSKDSLSIVNKTDVKANSFDSITCNFSYIKDRESVVVRVQVMLITYCFCDFLFHGYPCMTEENVML